MAAQTGLDYVQLALREGHEYLIEVTFVNGLRWCRSMPTLSEAIMFIDGAENAALYAVEEPIEGLAVKRKLAEVLFGEWCPATDQQELTMAKVDKARKGKDVVADLLGDSKPRKTKVMKNAEARANKLSKSAKNGKGNKATATRAPRASAFSDDQTIKILKKQYPGKPREGSNLHTSLRVLRSGMTVGQWQKARAKAGIENTGTGYLRQMVADGYVRVR